MDLNFWFAPLMNVLLLLLAVHVVTAALVGSAIASYGRFALWIGVVCAIVVPFAGPVVLLIVALTRASQNPSARATDVAGPAPAAESVATNPWELAGSGYSTELTVSALAVPATSFSSADPWNLGQAAPHDDAPLPSTSPQNPSSAGGRARRLLSRVTRLGTPSGRRSIIVLGIIIVAAALTLTQCWLVFDPTILPPLSVFAYGTMLEGAILVSLIIFLGGLGLAVIRPSRWASVLVSSVGGVWLFLAGFGLILAAPATAMLDSWGAMSHTVGELLTSLGIDPAAATVTLPNGMDLAAFGIDESQLSLASLDLAAPVPTATLELGPSLFLALGVGVLALVWAIVELRLAHRQEAESRTTA